MQRFQHGALCEWNWTPTDWQMIEPCATLPPTRSTGQPSHPNLLMKLAGLIQTGDLGV
ncbi:MAG: hypothetical protein PHQ05_12485 [Sterolibacterium sp.]|nr:hypothetical protein [Sterolibacterium sp.]